MWDEGVCIYGTPGVPNNFPNKQTRSWLGRSESEPFQRISECLIIGDTFANDQSAP